MTRQRLLWITSEISAEPRGGGALRTNRLVRALARSMDVHLLVIGAPGDVEHLKASTGAMSVEVFPPTVSPLRRRFTMVLKRWPMYFAYVWRHDAFVRARHLAQDADVVVLDHLHMAPYRPATGHYIVSLHNVESLLHAQLPSRSCLERRIELSLLRRVEASVVRDPRARIVVVSEHDGRLLGVHADVVPNGADVPASLPPLTPGGDVLFVGSYAYPPNREAVSWWVDHVWPACCHLPPLVVVGSNPQLLSLHVRSHPGVSIVGEVADVATALARASVIAIPLLHGSGTRLKVLEALAYGRPVVSTGVGVEGLPVKDGTHYLRADDAASFGEAVQLLLSNSELSAHLAGEGRALAERYAWDRVATSFDPVIAAAQRRVHLSEP